MGGLTVEVGNLTNDVGKDLPLIMINGGTNDDVGKD